MAPARAVDPLPQLSQKQILSEESHIQLETEVKAEIQAAVDRAEALMKNLGAPLEMFDHRHVHRHGQAALAIEMGALAEDLALVLHPFPTLTETDGKA